MIDEVSPMHGLILDFVYAHRAGWNGQIGSLWLPWKIFVYAVLFWAKTGSEITLWRCRAPTRCRNCTRSSKCRFLMHALVRRFKVGLKDLSLVFYITLIINIWIDIDFRAMVVVLPARGEQEE